MDVFLKKYRFVTEGAINLKKDTLLPPKQTPPPPPTNKPLKPKNLKENKKEK